MKLIGISLRRPTFGEITASSIMGAGLWVASVGVLQGLDVPLDAADAGALLLILLWGSLCSRVAIHVGSGHRHLVANLLVSALLLGLYQAAWAFTG